MRRKVFLVLILALIAWQNTFAKPAKKTEEKPAVKAPVAVAPAPDPLEAELKARQILNKKEWKIYFTPLGRPKVKAQSDTLSFYTSKVSSKRFAAKGYIESNYTVRTQPDGTFTWETMQKNDKEEIVFWKGELRGEEMMGVLSYHPKKGPNEDFYFTTLAPE